MDRYGLDRKFEYARTYYELNDKIKKALQQDRDLTIVNIFMAIPGDAITDIGELTVYYAEEYLGQLRTAFGMGVSSHDFEGTIYPEFIPFYTAALNRSDKYSDEWVLKFSLVFNAFDDRQFGKFEKGVNHIGGILVSRWANVFTMEGYDDPCDMVFLINKIDLIRKEPIGLALNDILRHVGELSEDVPEWAYERPCIVRNKTIPDAEEFEMIRDTVEDLLEDGGPITVVFLNIEKPPEFDDGQLEQFFSDYLASQYALYDYRLRPGILPNNRYGFYAMIAFGSELEPELGSGHGHGSGLLDIIKRQFVSWASDPYDIRMLDCVTIDNDYVQTITSLNQLRIPHDIIAEKPLNTYSVISSSKHSYGCPLKDGLNNSGYRVISECPPSELEIDYVRNPIILEKHLRDQARLNAIVIDVPVCYGQDPVEKVSRFAKALRALHTGNEVYVYHRNNHHEFRVLLLMKFCISVDWEYADGYGDGILDTVIQLWGQLMDKHYPAPHYEDVSFVGKGCQYIGTLGSAGMGYFNEDYDENLSDTLQQFEYYMQIVEKAV